jgi:hypothetical protein
MKDNRLPTVAAMPVPPPSTMPLEDARLHRVAPELEHAPPPPPVPANMMEAAVLHQTALEQEVLELRDVNAAGIAQIEEDRKHHAAEILRLNDQISFLKTQNENLQIQRDTFANYAIEVRTRMVSLTKVMVTSAKATEDAISSTMTEIDQFVANRLTALRELQASNAAMAVELVTEAQETAKSAVILKLAEQETEKAAS